MLIGIETTYQIWEEGFHPKLIQSEKMMMEKINYIHQNPVKRWYVGFEVAFWVFVLTQSKIAQEREIPSSICWVL